MRDHLIIGGDSLLGKAIRAHLEESDGGERIYWTTRRGTIEGYRDPRVRWLDLETLDGLPTLPRADFTYLVAAIPSTIACEREPELTWRVNVDAPLAIAHQQVQFGAVVFVSSDAVEFCGHLEYGRQKAHVEAALAMHQRCVVFRPGRFTNETVGDAAAALVSAGRFAGGLVRWP